jgi:hypothetical protein
MKLTQQQINYIVLTIFALIAFIFSFKIVSWFCFGMFMLLIGDDVFKYSKQIKQQFSRINAFIQLMKILWPTVSIKLIWRATQKK